MGTIEAGILDLLLGRGIAACPLLALAHLERAETRQANLSSALHGLLDVRKHGVHSLASLFLGKRSRFGHGVDQVLFAHVTYPQVKSFGRSIGRKSTAQPSVGRRARNGVGYQRLMGGPVKRKIPGNRPEIAQL